MMIRSASAAFIAAFYSLSSAHADPAPQDLSRPTSAAPIPVSPPQEAKEDSAGDSAHSHQFRRGPRYSASIRAIQAANRGALSNPHSNAFLNAALLYDYEVGRLYRLDTSPRFLSAIELRPGEHLVSKAAGDTLRWVLGETIQGAGKSAQTLVLIKPVRGGLRTNLILTTDQRTYFLEAVSHEEPVYAHMICWNYPLDILADHVIKDSSDNEKSTSGAEGSISLDRLNFAYGIEHPHQRSAPAWAPTRIFDDGLKTYILLPPGVHDAPPLFLIGPGNRAELVNYRVKSGYYIIDRLIDVAEMRLGESPQLVVRITRIGARG